MKATILLFLCAVSALSAAKITLQNDTATDQVMTAHGVHQDISVIVPASSFVEVEMPTVWFDLQELEMGVMAGIVTIGPFIVYGMTRKIFKEAE